MSLLYFCSLDAEKCFDQLWHSALLYKLWDVMPKSHWLLLYNWYQHLQAVVKWNNNTSMYFKITRGTRQGSVLSPVIFNVFIDDLLKEIVASDCGVKIGNFNCNSFAYADDITLLSATATGLQKLINVCTLYAQQWRFNFNITKTKCMTTGVKLLRQDPIWT